jgi:pimeloyl-ACP methyl ester carboxylesterase
MVQALLIALAATLGPDQFFQSDGVRIRYLVSGRGEPVVLVHGWSSSAEMWEPLIEDLSRDHQVIAMDCRGHGKSDKPHDPAAYGDQMVMDVVRLLDHLGLKKAHIVGYSMGGSIVAKMLTQYPKRFLSAVMGGSVGFRSTDGKWDDGLIKALSSGMPLSDAMVANRPAGMPPPSPQQREMMRQMDAMQDSQALAAQRMGNSGLWITDEELQRNKVPVLVIYGSRQDDQDSFRRAASVIGAVQVDVVEGTGHGSTPDSPQFVKDVRTFLAKHRGGRK